ncbi:hypothetical protein EUGRSUZ_I01204 [Eucalyptus grandis]|uniref:Uncharacterized protein n=2 Tax=Eucalyptus grandis TaxID=71139 RepID=A0ACC3JFG2_EUCGR|nr:hypothetical protein EUGRSUZ_I01204 [Eucalyptus grandis]
MTKPTRHRIPAIQVTPTLWGRNHSYVIANAGAERKVFYLFRTAELATGVFFAGVDFAGHGSMIGEIWLGFRAFFHNTDLVDLRVLSSVSEAKDLRSL